MRFNPTERIGINAVEKIFLDFGWIPRDILQSDVGIDMIVEIANNGEPTGHFFAVQIKTGKSYFKGIVNNVIIFRPKLRHTEYWVNNSLPVLLVLHNNDENFSIWQFVNKENILKTFIGNKIEVPLVNILNLENKSKIEKITESPPLLRKFNKLLLDKPIMELIRKDEKVVVEIFLDKNTLSGKAEIKIYHVHQEEIPEENLELKEELLVEFKAYGVHNYQTIYYFYPWADIDIDTSFYELFDEYDEDNMPGYKIAFIEDRFHGKKLPIIPYVVDSSFARYRLRMKLNDFGVVFLDFHDYISIGKQLKLKI